MTIYCNKNDYGFYWRFPVKILPDKTTKDLTGYSAKFYMWEAETGIWVEQGAAADVEAPATNGIVRYLVAVGDTDTAGTFKALVEVYKSGVVESCNIFLIIVQDREIPPP